MPTTRALHKLVWTGNREKSSLRSRSSSPQTEPTSTACSARCRIVQHSSNTIDAIAAEAHRTRQNLRPGNCMSRALRWRKRKRIAIRRSASGYWSIWLLHASRRFRGVPFRVGRAGRADCGVLCCEVAWPLRVHLCRTSCRESPLPRLPRVQPCAGGLSRSFANHLDRQVVVGTGQDCKLCA